MVLGLLAVASCGGRSPIDWMGYQAPAGGSGGTTTGAGGTGAVGATGSGGEGAQGATGQGGGGGYGPMDCFTCLTEQCSGAADCLMDPTCLQGMLCTVTSCLSGGEPDLECALECFNGDISAAMQAFESIMCVFQDCAAQCEDLFGGIPLPG